MKIAVFIGMLCLFSFSVSAQTNLNYSGTWALDAGKSKLDPIQLIDGMTLKVTQTSSDLIVETAISRKSNTGSKVRVRGGDGISTYPLDGREITVDRDSYSGKTSVKYSGKVLEDGKLSVSSSRAALIRGVTFDSTVKDTWSLLNNGKTLKIVRITNNPSGIDTVTEMIFIKN